MTRTRTPETDRRHLLRVNWIRMPAVRVRCTAETILPLLLALSAVVFLSACESEPVGSSEMLVIQNGTLIDGTGGEPVENGALLIHGDRIAAAGPESAMSIPADARTIDARGGFIVPGFIDAHVHYSQTGWFDGRPDAFDLREAYPYEEVIADLRANPDRFFRAYLCSGVTATFDVGGYPWTIDLGRGDPRASDDPAPDVSRSASGYAIDAIAPQSESALADTRPTGPHVEATGPLLSTIDFWLNLPDQKQFVYMADEEAVREAVRSHADQGASAVKVWFITPPHPPDSARAVRLVRAAGEEADRLGLPFVVHATGLWEAKEAVRAGADVLVHSVFDDLVDDEFLQLAAENEVIYTTTLTVLEGYRNALQSKPPSELPYPTACVDSLTIAKLSAGIPPERRPPLPDGWDSQPPAGLERGLQNLRRVHEAGITIAMGTDAGNPGTLHGPSVYREMELLTRAGLTSMDVLVASTRNGARAMNREADLGTLEAEKQADVVVLGPNPLDDVANFQSVRMVIKGGEVVWGGE